MDSAALVLNEHEILAADNVKASVEPELIQLLCHCHWGASLNPSRPISNTFRFNIRCDSRH